MGQQERTSIDRVDRWKGHFSSLLNNTTIVRLRKEMTWPSTFAISRAEVVRADKKIKNGKAPDPENNFSPLKS